MRVMLKIVLISLLSFALNLPAMAFSYDKDIEISNHSVGTLYFTVNGQCKEDITVGAHGNVTVYSFHVKYLCGDGDTCEFQSHQHSCSGAPAGSMKIFVDKSIQTQDGDCHKAEAHDGWHKVKLWISDKYCPF